MQGQQSTWLLTRASRVQIPSGPFFLLVFLLNVLGVFLLVSEEVKKSFDVSKHSLVPKHAKVSDSELKEMLQKFSIDISHLPKIIIDDPLVSELKLKEGDVVKVSRPSRTAGYGV